MRAIRIKENKLIIMIGVLAKPIKIWPAVMLAARRTDRVTGRIICLTVSIRTINCDRGRGVLVGTMCLRKCVLLNSILNIKEPIQTGRANLKVIAIWALIVKMYGKRPLTFTKRIKKNILTKILLLFFLFLLLIEEFISAWRIEEIIIKMFEIRCLILNFNKRPGTVKINKIWSRFILKNPPIGSKDLNSLVIMVGFF